MCVFAHTRVCVCVRARARACVCTSYNPSIVAASPMGVFLCACVNRSTERGSLFVESGENP